MKMVVYQCFNGECLTQFAVEMDSAELGELCCPACEGNAVIEIGETDVEWEANAE